jgi:hypothetical protein
MGCASSRTKVEMFDYSPVLDVALGRSLDSEYIKPAKKDMAIGIVFFNFCKSKKILMNYFYTVEKLRLANIPFFTLELVFGIPEIKEATHVYGKDALFHKESLLRILEQKIPIEFSKVMFMDCDLIFDNANWYNETSKLLDQYDVVQPFETCLWLDSTYTTVIQERKGVASMSQNTYDSKYHPGFAWAFRRLWYNQNGFYDLAITGSGDTLSAAAWMNVDFPPNYLQRAYDKTFKAYRKSLTLPKMSFAKGAVRHLWHGTKEGRNYMNRHKILQGVDEIMDVIDVKEGIIHVKNDCVKKDLETYFVGRFDDGV